ncbi:hypothetical protein FD33_GL000419 [Companilactobacillus paralimentarius DSM 13238 = JCM 10415]|jgi:hypothetical protein|uniref:Uncharacterized protein n=1 Tax=Companilactobacillus paralimentarius DSM 13238 = JCM 10415 TaxID=1122151 RepID=A0A0R1PUS3_9LACO|nr:hypothetical protein [Companilactobacillus paralimentarius]KAE9565559.1 hypothetical protein ATN96_02820 [Companilactobacillus paralimentarius]KRL32483.1 hypothetical protein FD33_GL000419 [Companilactobacillus paralimentarius DSM 13238 = JCM 10415]MDR4933598.1 hypothetical protein [Companilactobacillus paralimentarius]QFR70061.1 hypothetical protein LP238_10060 [Companilactobacillus paralimentarius]
MAEDTGVWLSKELSKLADKQKAYENRAFLTAMKKVVEEQNDRMKLLQGEVDGRLWNHEQW